MLQTGTSYTNQFTLSGAATEGSFVYVTQDASSFLTFFGISAQFTSNTLNVNGDDVLELFKDGEKIDQFGRQR